MKRYFLLIITFLFSHLSIATVIPPVTLETATVNINDITSIKRGAKFFATICMACHTLIYLRYDKLAQEAGITYEKMPTKVTSWPNGIKPPDLSLEANARGVNWIYTYLHSFYIDKSRPTGFNNLILPNTAMVAILSPFQGQQVIASDIKLNEGVYDRELQWYDILELKTQGSMTPAQFDHMVTDIVNFLNYAANPYENKQKKIGLWTIGFLVILFLLMYLLKREYWKDVKKK